MRRTNSVSFYANKYIYTENSITNLACVMTLMTARRLLRLFFVKYIKLSRNKSEDSEREWNVGLTHSLLLHSTQLGQQSCKVYAPAAIYPQGRSLVFTLLGAEWTPGLLYADRRNKSLENFQRPCRESHPEPPILWRRASTTCTARCTFTCMLPIAINFRLLAYLLSAKKRRQCVTIPCVSSLSNGTYP